MKKEDIKVTVNIIPKYETKEEYNKAMAKIFAEFHYDVNCRL